MDLAEKISERLMKCKTSKDLYDAYGWLAGEAIALNSLNEDIERTIVDLYGEKALQKVYEKVESYEIPVNDVQRIIDYGYTKGGMVSISAEVALDSLNNGMKVWALNPDNTEKQIFTKEEIENSSMLALKEEDIDKQLDDLFEDIFEK